MNRTCNELGVCQGRAPACAGCTAHPFAPGVIDGYPKQQGPSLKTFLLRWVWLTVAIVAVCGIAGYLV